MDEGIVININEGVNWREEYIARNQLHSSGGQFERTETLKLPDRRIERLFVAGDYIFVGNSVKLRVYDVRTLLSVPVPEGQLVSVSSFVSCGYMLSQDRILLCGSEEFQIVHVPDFSSLYRAHLKEYMSRIMIQEPYVLVCESMRFEFYLLDLRTMKRAHAFEFPDNLLEKRSIPCFAFSKDGTRIAVASCDADKNWSLQVYTVNSDTNSVQLHIRIPLPSVQSVFSMHYCGHKFVCYDTLYEMCVVNLETGELAAKVDPFFGARTMNCSIVWSDHCFFVHEKGIFHISPETGQVMQKWSLTSQTPGMMEMYIYAGDLMIFPPPGKGDIVELWRLDPLKAFARSSYGDDDSAELFQTLKDVSHVCYHEQSGRLLVYRKASSLHNRRTPVIDVFEQQRKPHMSARRIRM